MSVETEPEIAPEIPPAPGHSIGIGAVLAAAVLIGGIAILVLLGGLGHEAPTSGERVEVALPPVQQLPSLAPPPGLVENSPDGPLPTIGMGGRQAWQVYARPFNLADKRPRVALVIGGLGLDKDLTVAAIDRLPGPVTLAFSPYARDLQQWIDRARRAGHEVLIGLPLEPTDYPRRDPGPDTLLTSLDATQNLKRLRWVMSRATGYVGLLGIMGDRFITVRESFEPVLAELKMRGVMFVDGSPATDSSTGKLAAELVMAWAVSDRVIDGEAPALTIDNSLADLEKIAARGGAALGVGMPYPLIYERLLAWVPTLAAKSIVLAPSSAVATRQIESP